MILYGVLVTMVILLLICFKGPIELMLLANMGFDLVSEAFEVQAKTSSFEGLARGGMLTLILVVQPITFGFLALKLLHMVFKYSLLAKLEERRYLRLESSSDSKPKSEVDLIEMVSQTKPFQPTVASTSGGVFTAGIDDLMEFGRKKKTLRDWAVHLIVFRGSRAQILIGGTLFLALLATSWVQRPLFAATIAFFFLSVVIGPTMVLYLSILADYSQKTELALEETKFRYSPDWRSFEEARRKSLTYLTYDAMSDYRYNQMIAKVRARESSTPGKRVSLDPTVEKEHQALVARLLEEIDWLENQRDFDLEDYKDPRLSPFRREVYLRSLAREVSKKVPGVPRAKRQLYEPTPRQLRREKLSRSKARGLKLTTNMLFLKCVLTSRKAILLDRETRSQYLEEKKNIKEIAERSALPGISRSLEILGEERADGFSFRSNIFSYKFMGHKQAILRWFSRLGFF